MSKIDAVISKFNKLNDELFEIVDGLTEGQINWKLQVPLGDDYWSVRQILAHIEEVNFYWIHLLREAINNPTGFAARSPEDMKKRQDAVDNAINRDLSAITYGVKKSIFEANKMLETITDEEYDTMLGKPDDPRSVPYSWLINHVYPEHIEEHIKHIKRTLFAYSQYN